MEVKANHKELFEQIPKLPHQSDDWKLGRESLSTGLLLDTHVHRLAYTHRIFNYVWHGHFSRANYNDKMIRQYQTSKSAEALSINTFSTTAQLQVLYCFFYNSSINKKLISTNWHTMWPMFFFSLSMKIVTNEATAGKSIGWCLTVSL